MDVTLRCRAYPDEETASEAWRHIEIHRQIRNHAIRDCYSRDYGNRPTAYDQHRKLTGWKQRWPLFSEVSAHAAQQTVSEIHKNVETQKARRENGHKAGRLNWRRSGERRSVAYLSEGSSVNHTTGQDGYATLRLSKIGHIPIRAHWELPATEGIKRAVLKKERTGNWFVCLVTERPDDDLPEKPESSALDPADCVGVDLGILSYIHTSDDTAVDMLDLSDEYDHYVREQPKLHRREHGSNNWEKQRQLSLRPSVKSNRKRWTTSTGSRRGLLGNTTWWPSKIST